MYELLALFGSFMALMWIIFPFVVDSRLNKIARLLEHQNKLIDWIADRGIKYEIKSGERTDTATHLSED